MKFAGRSLAQTAFVLLMAVRNTVADSNVSDIAYWLSPRVALIQNTVVIEGGVRALANYSAGTWSEAVLNTSPDGRLYYMSMCSSFNTATDNIDALAQHYNESQNPQQNSWSGGALFATEYEWYTFGGLPQFRRQSTDINVMQANMYRPPSSPSPAAWSPGVDDTYSPSYSANVSNDLAYGAWTNAPSESLGFWFSGLQSASGGYIDSVPFTNHSDQANTTSRTFIKVDMSQPTRAQWQNMTWPNWLAPRAEGGLVWLPYGSRGILLAFGGVDLPGDLGTSGIFLNTTQKSATNQYMTNIGVYDIASDTWALQQTLEASNPPTQMAEFCTVTASASDNSSHFVYVYGGYDGTYKLDAALDSIWVLSVPAFQWTQLTAGTASHRRMRHQCVLANPTQMLSIGGGTEVPTLIQPDWLDVYDLNAQNWTHAYDALSTATYKVPAAITSQLGQGTADGGFTIPSSGLNSTVSTFLNTPYKKIIPGYSPYNWCAPNITITPTGNSTNTSVPAATSTGSHKKNNTTPSWQTPVIAVLAVIAGLAILGALVFFCCIRNRKDKDGNKRSRVTSWIGKSDPPQPRSDPDSEHTAVERDYFNNAKGPDSGVYEMSSPGLGAHGTPRVVGSPSFGGEMESSTRHEIMTNPPRDSMSIGQHPYYPRSIQGDFINRSVAGSESISSPSMGPIPSTLAANVNSRSHSRGGQMSPFELAPDRSNEDLPSPPLDDRALDVSSEGGSSSVFGGQQMNSPLPMSPAINRKPVSPMVRPITPLSGELRPGHVHQSSMSSDVPTLPSPTPAEDQRRSRIVNDLPDLHGNSPVVGGQVQPQQQPTKKASGPLKSAYQEKFED